MEHFAVTPIPWPAINTVFRRIVNDKEKMYDRLLWISLDRKSLYFIDVFGLLANPFAVDSVTFDKELADGTLTAVQHEKAANDAEILARCCPPLLSRSEAETSGNESQAQYRAQDRAWNGLTPLLKAGPEQYFQPSKRRALVRNAAVAAEVSEKTIQRWFRTYCQLGQTKNALVPAYTRRGGRGKPRLYTGRKLGRPSVRGGLNTDEVGINVTGNVAKQLLIGINRYYIRGGRTMEQAYQATLEDSFADEDWTSGYPVPVLWQAHLCPTKGQFAYWARKTKYGDLAKSLTLMIGERRYGRELRPQMGQNKRRWTWRRIPWRRSSSSNPPVKCNQS
jgi:hypothetical protein